MSHHGRSNRPPAIARALIRMGLRRDVREIVGGDLDESFAADLARLGRRTARRRYWALALRSIASRWTPEPRPGPGFAALAQPNLFADVKLGARRLWRQPGFSLAMAGTLALGIAATTTVFGLSNALLLKPLPYADHTRVLFLLGWNTEEDRMRFNLRYADAADLEARMGSLDAVAMYRAWNANLSGGDLPERVQAYAVSANTFDLLGVRAAHGRTFGPLDAAGDGRVVVLGHGLWTTRYGGDPTLVGRPIALDGADYLVVGVMPPAFEFPIFNFKGDLWTPLQPTPEWTAADRRASPSIVAIGRLAPGTSVAAAQSEASGLMAQLGEAYPDTNRTVGVRVMPMADLGREQTAPAFAILGATALLVLILACTNAASLQLAHGIAIGREAALRAALGASRWRLLRQFIIESGWLAVTGGVVGLGTAWVALEGLRRATPAFVERVLPGISFIRIDLDAVVFAALASAATVIAFGVLPAWRAARPALTGTLRAGTAGMDAPVRSWVRNGLVVAEVAVAAALLVTTSLLVQSAAKLAEADPGFDADRTLGFTVSLPATRYPTVEAANAYFERLIDRLSGVPGVEAVGTVNVLPFSTANSTVAVLRPGRPEPSRADFRSISPGYLTALDLDLVAGRSFTPADSTGEAAVVLVNETFVREHVPDGAAVGRAVALDVSGYERATIAGVVRDSLHWTLEDGPAPTVYLPAARTGGRTRSVAVRTPADPASLANVVRARAAELDPGLALYDLAPLRELVDNSFLAQRISAQALVVFGTVAIALTAFGVYALLAFVVGRRTREIGVRVALGADRGDVLRLVLRRSIVLTVAGVAIGLGLAAVAAQGLASLLFGVGPLDLASYATASATLVSVALLASWVPARRALRIDPVRALRCE